MIINIGTDIVALVRIAKIYHQYPIAFQKRLLTAAEREEFSKRQHPISYLAGRWAAKEAIGKALSCGIKFGFQEMEVLTSPSGAPSVKLYGAMAKLAAELNVSKVHLSISHERDYATAVVVLEGSAI